MAPAGMNEPIQFHVPFACGHVDKVNHIIYGVALMTGDLTAEGHELEVDEKTLEQVLGCAKKTGKIPVKLNHGAGIENLNGYIDGATAFKEGNKIRGNWHLLASHDETAKMEERAEKQPETFGMSAAFKGGGEVLKDGAKKGRKAARCERLLSVDCVTQPAANPDGLFAAKVDTWKMTMPTDINTNTSAELDGAPAWAKSLIAKVDQLEASNNELREALSQQQQPEELSLEDLANMTEEEVEAAGYDFNKVQAAVQDAIAAGELTAEGGAPADTQGDGQGGSQGAGAVAPAAAGTGFSANVQDIVQFEIAKVQRMARNAAEQAEAEHAFALIEQKVTELSTINEELTTELSTKDAEIKSLRATLKSTEGHRASSPGIEFAANLANGKFQEGTYEHVVQAEFSRLVKAGKSETEAKALAFEHGIKKHGGLYAEFRARGAKPIELSVNQ